MNRDLCTRKKGRKRFRRHSMQSKKVFNRINFVHVELIDITIPDNNKP